MRRASILPIAIMVGAVGAFLVVGYFALPWKVFHQCPLIGIQCQPGTVQYDSRQCFKSCTPVSHSNTNSTTTTNTASNTNTSTNTNTVSTADWKTYTNTDDHYTLKYPTDYAQSLNGKTIEFQKKGDLTKIGLHLVTVSVFRGVDANINSSLDLYTWAKNGFSPTAPIEVSHVNPQIIHLGETTFVKTEGDTGSSGIPEYFVFHNNVLYELTNLHPSTMASDNLDIISTLHFTK